MLRHLPLVRGLSGRVLQRGFAELRGLYGPGKLLRGMGGKGGRS